MDARHANRSRVGAILLNPARAANRVSRTRLVLEDVRVAKAWGTVEIANLVETPTRNSKELEQVATSVQLFLDARDRLDTVLASSDTLVFAWGIAPLRGLTGTYVRDQVNWVISRVCLPKYSAAAITAENTTSAVAMIHRLRMSSRN